MEIESIELFHKSSLLDVLGGEECLCLFTEKKSTTIIDVSLFSLHSLRVFASCLVFAESAYCWMLRLSPSHFPDLIFVV